MEEINSYSNDIVLVEIPVRINKIIKEVLDTYLSMRIPYSQLMEDYLAVIGSELQDAENPWVHYQKGIKKRQVESGVSKMESAFIFGAMKLVKQKPTDVIRAAFYKTRNDSGLECGFLLDEYINNLAENEDSLIVNPSPDMIIRFEERRKGKGKKYYVVPDETIAQLYKIEFKQSIFYYFDDEPRRTFGSALIINRDIEIEKTEYIARWMTFCEKNVLAELPNAYLDNYKYGAYDLLKKSGYAINKIIILHSELTVTSPKKKCLVYLGKDANVQAWNLFNTEYQPKTKRFRVIDKKITIAKDGFWKNKFSLVQLWNRDGEETVENEAKYKEAREYVFSKEIKLAYCIYPERRNSYAGKCWYKKMINAYPPSYSKRVSPMIEKGLRALTEEAIINNLWQIVFDERVYPFIYTDLQIFYFSRKESVSLKTLWVYMHNVLSSLATYDEVVLIELLALEDGCIGEFKADEQNDDELLNLMSSQLNLAVEEIPSKYFKQLDLLFETAQKAKYIKHNPLASIMPTVVRRASARQSDIRKVLCKKHFSDIEEEKIFQFLIEPVKSDFYGKDIPRCVEQSIWLSGIIRLFSGMSLREVCALRWDDFVEIEGTEEYQLRITKFLNQHGEIVTHSENEDWDKFRCVPVARPLKYLLISRRQYLVDRGIDEYVIKNSPIVLTTEEIKSLRNGGRSLFCKPAKAQEYCKRIIEQADIETHMLILPDVNGEIKVDIYKYNGDIFVTNIKNQLNHYCAMTMGEICYILGVVGPDTFSRHYCDYSNELILYSMIGKMNRWTSKYEMILRGIKSASATRGCFEGGRAKFESGPYYESCASSEIVLKSDSDIGCRVKLSISCEHKPCVDIKRYKGE